MEKRKSLEERVREIASGVDNATFISDEDKRRTHIEVCKKLVDLSDSHGKYPVTYLVYFSIGKNAHRTEVFDKGYSRIDEDKAETVFKMLEMFSYWHENPKLFRNPNTAHIFCKYYENRGGNVDFGKFKREIEAYTPNPKITTFNRVRGCPWFNKKVKKY